MKRFLTVALLFYIVSTINAQHPLGVTQVISDENVLGVSGIVNEFVLTSTGVWSTKGDFSSETQNNINAASIMFDGEKFTVSPEGTNSDVFEVQEGTTTTQATTAIGSHKVTGENCVITKPTGSSAFQPANTTSVSGQVKGVFQLGETSYIQTEANGFFAFDPMINQTAYVDNVSLSPVGFAKVSEVLQVSDSQVVVFKTGGSYSAFSTIKKLSDGSITIQDDNTETTHGFLTTSSRVLCVDENTAIVAMSVLYNSSAIVPTELHNKTFSAIYSFDLITKSFDLMAIVDIEVGQELKLTPDGSGGWYGIMDGSTTGLPFSPVATYGTQYVVNNSANFDFLYPGVLHLNADFSEITQLYNVYGASKGIEYNQEDSVLFVYRGDNVLSQNIGGSLVPMTAPIIVFDQKSIDTMVVIEPVLPQGMTIQGSDVVSKDQMEIYTVTFTNTPDDPTITAEIIGSSIQLVVNGLTVEVKFPETGEYTLEVRSVEGNEIETKTITVEEDITGISSIPSDELQVHFYNQTLYMNGNSEKYTYTIIDMIGSVLEKGDFSGNYQLQYNYPGQKFVVIHNQNGQQLIKGFL